MARARALVTAPRPKRHELTPATMGTMTELHEQHEGSIGPSRRLAWSFVAASCLWLIVGLALLAVSIGFCGNSDNPDCDASSYSYWFAALVALPPAAALAVSISTLRAGRRGSLTRGEVLRRFAICVFAAVIWIAVLAGLD